MKSKLWIIPALVLCIVSCLAFTACGDNGPTVQLEKAELDLKYVAATEGVAEHFDVLGVVEGDTNKNLIIPDTIVGPAPMIDGETGQVLKDEAGNDVMGERELPITGIVTRAFYNNTAIETIEIGNNVTSIGDRAFDNCTSVKTLTIGTGIQNIPEKAFLNCSSITSVVIPKTVKSIGISAFEGCTSLSEITFEDEGLTSIATRAFYGCAAIEEIKIPKSVTFIDVDAFALCEKILDRATKEEQGLTVFADSIT